MQEESRKEVEEEKLQNLKVLMNGNFYMLISIRFIFIRNFLTFPLVLVLSCC
jgi:hypothetical protein